MPLTTLSQFSDLNADPNEVWAFVTTPIGINFELMPIMRMTVPESLKGLTMNDVALGQKLGRSWLLLFGVIPIDYDDLMLVELDPGKRFLENSTMLAIKDWQHERILTPTKSGGCRVEDKLAFRMRLPLPGSAYITSLVLTQVFRHRHRKLAKRFGTE